MEQLLTAVGEWPVIIDDLAYERAAVDLNAFERDGAVLDARHLEQILRELLEPPHVAIGPLRKAALLGTQRPGPLGKQ